MSQLGLRRARHVKEAIGSIRDLLAERSYQQARQDKTVWLAYERCLEIVSEATRHIPEDWKVRYDPNIPWRKVSDLGNVLRHIYHNVDAPALWSIYENDLDALEAAIDAMLAEHEADEA